MIKLVRTNSDNKDFRALVLALDQYLAKVDGEEHGFYAQYNKVDLIKHVVIAYEIDVPLACGAIKAYDSHTMEVKRMYTSPESRGKGLAGKVLSELENWAVELGYQTCILETGKRQTDAIRLYEKSGYHVFPNYGQYEGIENSICFKKQL